MALKLMLESLDGLSDEIAKEYVERDGKFYLDWQEVGGLKVEDVSGLKTALEKERKAARENAAKLKRFEGIDDPDAARSALEKLEEFENFDPDKKVEEKMKSREASLLKQHEKERDKIAKRAENAEGQLKKVLVQNAALDALQKAGGRASLMLPHVLGNVRMRQTDSGEYIAEVVDSEGNPRVGDSAGNPMTIPQLVAEMKQSEDFAAGFDGTGATGGGGAGGARQPAKPGSQQSGGGGKKPIVIPASDQSALNANAEKIANGEAVVDFDA